MMGLLVQIAVLLIETAFSVYIGFVWLRFVLQLVRGDFYNPFSQFIVKVTNPLLKPLRRVVPSLAGMDTASLVLIVLLEMIEVTLFGLLLSGGHLVPPIPLVLLSVFLLLKAALRFYLVGIFIYVLLGWVAPGNYSPGIMLVQQVFAPAIAPFRRLMPDTGGLDFSPMVAGLCLIIFGMILDKAVELASPLMGSWAYLLALGMGH
jgi:YggT family protein